MSIELKFKEKYIQYKKKYLNLLNLINTQDGGQPIPKLSDIDGEIELYNKQLINIQGQIAELNRQNSSQAKSLDIEFYMRDLIEQQKFSEKKLVEAGIRKQILISISEAETIVSEVENDIGKIMKVLHEIIIVSETLNEIMKSRKGKNISEGSSSIINRHNQKVLNQKRIMEDHKDINNLRGKANEKLRQIETFINKLLGETLKPEVTIEKIK